LEYEANRLSYIKSSRDFNFRGQILNLCKAEQHYCRENTAGAFTRQKLTFMLGYLGELGSANKILQS